MKRYVLTGTPGAGKTAILRQLEANGFSVVEEVASDVIALWQARGIAEPWMHSGFLDAVARLQRQRRVRSSCEPPGLYLDVQFHDRSPICTAALANYLGFSISEGLAEELATVAAEPIFEKKVFFIRNLGFIEPTAARRISFEESLHFEQIHQDTYRSYGYELIYIEPASLAERVAAIEAIVRIR